MIPETIRQPHWNNDVDWLYIQGLSKAIESVPINYIRECSRKRKFHLERIFSYELYYRWSRLLERKQENPEHLFLNAELVKHYDEMRDYKFPDLVLHGDYINREKQYIICEIKSSRNQITEDALKKDLESLQNGIWRLLYKCGVFIYLGNNSTKMVSRLRTILQTFENYVGNIIFIGVNCGVPHYEIL